MNKLILLLIIFTACSSDSNNKDNSPTDHTFDQTVKFLSEVSIALKPLKQNIAVTLAGDSIRTTRTVIFIDTLCKVYLYNYNNNSLDLVTHGSTPQNLNDWLVYVPKDSVSQNKYLYKIKSGDLPINSIINIYRDLIELQAQYLNKKK